jgi:hypothetical protein
MAATSDVQPSQTQATTSRHEINSLQEAVVSLHHAIQKININERNMKTILVDTKTVQVKLRSPPNAPLGTCCLCQCHSTDTFALWLFQHTEMA